MGDNAQKGQFLGFTLEPQKFPSTECLDANWRKYCSPFSVASDFIKQGVVNDKLH